MRTSAGPGVRVAALPACAGSRPISQAEQVSDVADEKQTEELDQLRRRVAELESELSTARSREPEPHAAPGGGRWRSVTSAIAITLACVLAPLSVVAVWANNQVSDTNRYVETVAPLAKDPAVQKAVADRVTQEVLAYVNLDSLTSDTVTALTQRGLPPRAVTALQALRVPIRNGLESFTRDQITKIVASPQFATVWEQANRAAHTELVNLLSGKQGGAVSAQNGEVTLNLGPIVAQVKQQLVASGYTIANNIPTVNRTFVLVRSDSITKAQGAYKLLNALGSWLPVIALLLLGLGVYLARDHRRAVVRGALGVVGSMLVLGVLIALARPLYLDAVPADVLPRQAAGDIFDTLVRFLRNGLRTTAVLFLVIAIGAFFTGPSVTAVRTRSALSRGIGSVRGGAESAGLSTGPVGTWTYAHKRLLNATVVILGGLVLTFWSRPTIAVVLWTAVGVLLAIGIVELVGRPPVTTVAGAAVPVPRQREAGAATAPPTVPPATAPAPDTGSVTEPAAPAGPTPRH
jgi:hypothetical protein